MRHTILLFLVYCGFSVQDPLYDVSEYQNTPNPPPISSPAANECLSRIRLAASFDPSISFQINRFIDSLRLDRLREFVCEKTSYFCEPHQQHQVGDVFRQFDKGVEIIEHLTQCLSSTEKDQLNMMENLNDTVAEKTFYLYKFHQLNPLDLAVLQSAKEYLTKALSFNTPDANLSRAMGLFTTQDLQRIESLPEDSIPEEIRSHLARCQITASDTVNDTISFILALKSSKSSMK